MAIYLIGGAIDVHHARLRGQDGKIVQLVLDVYANSGINVDTAASMHAIRIRALRSSRTRSYQSHQSRRRQLMIIQVIYSFRYYFYDYISSSY